MTVLVTGGAGYIGSHMVWNLIDAGRKVVVLDNLSTGFRFAVAPEATLVVGDIGDAALLDRVMREHAVEAVIHFAGAIVVPESVTDPLKYYGENTVKSHALISAAVRNGVRAFIFSSTAAVYGEAKAEMVTEAEPTVPMSPYGWSKLMTERILADVSAAHGLPVGVLRYFNVCGADPRGRTGQSTAGATHLIKVACETALGKREKLSIFGTDYPTPDGTGVRDYIHVSDLAAAHALVLNHLLTARTSLTVNCGYGRGYSVREVIGAVERVTGKRLNVEERPRRDGDVGRVVASSERIRTLLGWTPALDDLDLIVGHAIAWERALATRNDLRG